MKKINLRQIIRNGGATLDHNGNVADIRGGYMASYKGGEVCDISKRNKIARAVYRIAATLRPFEYLGIWVSNGLVYVDRSVNIKQLAHAQRFGAINEQLKIWDINNERELDCIIY